MAEPPQLRGKSRQFPPGQSGNPGGRPSIAKAWAEATGGKTMSQIGAEILRVVYDVAIAGPSGTKDATWTFAAGTALAYSLGKPREIVEVRTDLTEEEYQSELEAITREQLAKLPVEERLKLITDPAPTDTIQ